MGWSEPAVGLLPSPGSYARRHRRRLHRHNEALLRRLIADPTGAIGDYETTYRASFAGLEPVPAGLRELTQEIRNRRILVLGDYHTSSRVAEESLWLVDLFLREGLPLALALEIFTTNQTRELALFLAGELTLDGLRNATRFDHVWGVALWNHYAPLLAWARRRRIPVTGINAPGEPLADRDRIAAHAITSFARKNPGRKIITLVGELHTAPGHLPGRLREMAGFGPVVVHQNAEPVSWKLEKRNQTAPWLQIGGGRFVRQIAHPLVHQSTFTFHVLSAEHLDPLDNWERAFRYTAKRLGEIAALDLRPLLDRIHILPGATAGEVAVTSTLGSVSPVEAPLRPEMDTIGAVAARAVVRFSRHLNGIRRTIPDPGALRERENIAASVAGIWLNPVTGMTESTGLALQIDRALSAGQISPQILRNLFLGTGYPRETDSALLHRITATVRDADLTATTG